MDKGPKLAWGDWFCNEDGEYLMATSPAEKFPAMRVGVDSPIAKAVQTRYLKRKDVPFRITGYTSIFSMANWISDSSRDLYGKFTDCGLTLTLWDMPRSVPDDAQVEEASLCHPTDLIEFDVEEADKDIKTEGKTCVLCRGDCSPETITLTTLLDRALEDQDDLRSDVLVGKCDEAIVCLLETYGALPPELLGPSRTPLAVETKSNVHIVLGNPNMSADPERKLMTMWCGGGIKHESVKSGTKVQDLHGVIRKTTYQRAVPYCYHAASRTVHFECWRAHQREQLQTRYKGDPAVSCLTCGSTECVPRSTEAAPRTTTVLFDVAIAAGMIVYLRQVAIRHWKRTHPERPATPTFPGGGGPAAKRPRTDLAPSSPQGDTAA